MAGKPQNALFGPFKFLDEHVHVSKMGEVTICAKLDGIDFECATDTALETQHSRMLTAFQSLPEQIRPMFYAVKMDGAEIEAVSHPNAIVDRTVAARHRFLQQSSSSVSTISLYLALTYEPKRLLSFSQAGVLKVSRKKLNVATNAVHAAMRMLSQTVGDLLGITVMHKQEVFTFLRFLKTLDPELAAAEPLEYDDNVDHWTGANMITIHPTGIRNHRARPEVLTMRKLPKTSFPNMLREMLSVPGNFILCSQWKPEPNEKSLSAVRAAESHWNFMRYIKSPQAVVQLIWNQGETNEITPDAAAQEKVDRLNAVVKDLSRGESYAWFMFTAVCFHKSQERIESASRQLIKIIGNQQGSLVRETYYAAGPYASLVPGTTPKFRQTFRQRQRKLPLAQCLDLALVYNHSRGEAKNPLTKQPCLLKLATSDNTIFDFNLVPPGGDRTGVLLIGESGSGKSTFEQLCVDHAQKYNPRTLILDGMGGSFKFLSEKHSGTYYHLDPDGADWKFTLAPFQLDDAKNKKTNRQYLTTLVKICMSTGGYRGNAESNQKVYDEVCRVLDLPFAERRFSSLQFEGDMEIYLRPWVQGGQYDFVFDNKEDSFQLSQMQTVDFSRLSNFPEICQPLLFHFFKCWNDVVYDDALLKDEKWLVIDELAHLIKYKSARRYIAAAGVGWRKRMGGIFLAVHSLGQLEKAGMMETVNEFCPLKLLLRNPWADTEKYKRALKMNDKTAEIYSKLHQPGSGVMLSANLAKPFFTPLDPLALATYANDAFSNTKRNAAIEAHQGDIMKALESLAAEKAS
jgi:type IV secretory pathway VirB4 component